MQRFLTPFCLVAIVAAFAACGSSTKASSAATPETSAGPTTNSRKTTTAAPGPTITISRDLKFSSIPVKASATVTVRNESVVEHTVSADTAAGTFDITMEPGKTMTFTAPSKPGAYRFHCNIHTFMHGTLQVT